jgi:hypothetical protein
MRTDCGTKHSPSEAPARPLEPELERDISRLRASLEHALPAGPSPLLLSASFLERCLRSKKMSPSRAETVVRRYAQFRQLPGWETINAAGVAREARTAFNTVLPCPDACGRVVLTQRMSRLDLRLGAAQPGERPTSIEAYQRMAYYLLHRALHARGSHTGLALLIDFRGFSWAQMCRMRWSDFRRGIAMVEQSFPAHLECVYVLHPPFWISRLLGLIRPFLHKSSLQKKLVLLRHEDELWVHIPRESVPAEFGGRGQAEPWEVAFNRWRAQEQQWQAASQEAGEASSFDCLILLAAEGEMLRNGEGADAPPAGSDGVRRRNDQSGTPG